FRPGYSQGFGEQPGQGLDHLLDDPQIKEYRGKGRKEDDRWQDLKGKDVPEFVHVHHQALKEEPTARTCNFQYAYKELAHHFKEVLYKGYLKDPNGDQELQGQTDPHRFPVDGLSVCAEYKGDKDHGRHSKAAPP